MNKNREEKPCDLELLLWTLTKERVKRVGKLIEASITRAYKNAHLSIGIVCKWEIGQREWQAIPKKQIIELSKLMSSDTRIGTPSNGSTNNVRHDLIKGRVLSVWTNRLLYLMYTKSSGHYRRSNDILFTPYPTLHILSVGIIGVDREVRVELSNQNNRRVMWNVQKW